MNLLSLMILSPLTGCILLLFIPRSMERLIKVVSGIFLGISFILGIVLTLYFDKSLPGAQFVDEFLWIRHLGVKYMVGVDGISILFVVLSCLTALIVYFLSLKNTLRVKDYFVLLLIESAALTGCFASLDTLLFFVFLQISIIPVFIMISIWGGANKIFASRQFIVYSFVSSVIFLSAAVVFYIYAAGEGFSTVNAFAVASSIPVNIRILLFILLYLAFSILSGIFPFHGWICQAVYQAPTQVSILLSAVWMKIGIYGMLRYLYQINPFELNNIKYFFAFAGLLAGFYGAFYCAAQKSIRSLVSYSAVFFGGFFVLAFGSFEPIGVSGMVFNMLSHGVLVAMLFMVSDNITEITGTDSIKELGSLSGRTPLLSFFAAAAVFGSFSFPGTGTFVGAFTSVLGAFKSFPVLSAVFLVSYLVYAGVFLRLLQEVFYIDKKELRQNAGDLSVSQIAQIAPSFALLVFMGVAPKYIINITAKAVAALFG